MGSRICGRRLPWLSARVVAFLASLDIGVVLDRPLGQCHGGFDQRPAHRSEFVLDARWHLGKDRAAHEPVTFQVPQRQGQHPLRDAGDSVLNLGEAHAFA
jgi:hypothetical protein